MWQKVYFLGTLVFFLAMNILLWRSQYGQKDITLPMPVETVTRRMFSATDDSTLDINRRGVKIGHCRWSPQTLSQAPVSSGPRASLPEGMIGSITGYSISFDGTVMLQDGVNLRFYFSLELSTNFAWRAVHAWLAMPEYRIDARSAAGKESVQITWAQGDHVREQNFSFHDLRDPRALVTGLGGGLAVQALAAAGLAFPQAPAGGYALGLDWEAHTDRQRMGDTSFPVYRLQTEFLDNYRLRATVLPSGELLRVELPDEIVLINDKLSSM